MRTLALAAIVMMSTAPSFAKAQNACPANAALNAGVCVCLDGYILGAGGSCILSPVPDLAVAVDRGAAGAVPVFNDIPPGAIAIGGLALMAGALIGTLAADDDQSSTTTTTTTN